MAEAAQLDVLFRALRDVGLHVGVREAARLDRVLGEAVDAPHASARLKSLVRAVVVKSEEDLAACDLAVEQWLAFYEETIEASQTRLASTDQARGDSIRESGKPRSIRWAIVALLLVSTLTGAVALWRQSIRADPSPTMLEQPEKSVANSEGVLDSPISAPSALESSPSARSTTENPAALSSEESDDSTSDRPASVDWRISDDPNERKFIAWVPTISHTPPPPNEDVSLAWLVSLSIGALALASWIHLHWSLTEVRETEDVDLPSTGAPRILVKGQAAELPDFLDEPRRELLVWGLDRFTSETPSSKLDVQATVDVTAAGGGLLQVVFEPERPRREAHLWLDVSCADPEIRALADEIEGVLKTHGGSVHRSSFNGVPDVLIGADGARFRPREVDELRDRARVAVLTDGRRLLAEYRDRRERPELESCMRDLSHWSRLAVVDFSVGDLAPFLRRFQIRQLTPPQLPAFLGGVPEKTGSTRSSDLGRLPRRLQQAVCALPPTWPDVVSRAAAWIELGFQSSRWSALSRATAFASPQPSERAREVAWLRTREPVDASSLFTKAVAFWLECHDRRLAELSNEDQDGPGGRRLRAERAWLALFQNLQIATEQLWALYGDASLRHWIRTQMAWVDFADREDRIPLPVARADVDALTVQKLVRMGLGGQRYNLHRITPGRARLVAAVCLGMAVAALFQGFRPDERPQEMKPELPELVFPHIAEQTMEPTPDGRYRVSIDVHGALSVEASLPADSEVFVTWSRDLLTCKDLDPAQRQRVELCKQTSYADNDPCVPQERWHEDAGMMMVKLCAGTFTMGTADDDPQAEFAFSREKPAHKVTLSAFWIGKHEVSHRRFSASQPDSPNSWRAQTPDGVNAADLPATNMTWHEADTFCRSLGDGYRLPTEAEWEYAARAGTRTPWSFGSETEQVDGSSCSGRKFFEGPCPLGVSIPNPWGLHDVHGNVREWTLNWFSDNYEDSDSVDPEGPTSGEFKVLRGGDFWFQPRILRSAFRDKSQPEDRVSNRGFRCAFRQP